MSILNGILASSGAIPDGTAGGDLSGTYPNPTVASAHNGLISFSNPSGTIAEISAANVLLLESATNGSTNANIQLEINSHTFTNNLGSLFEITSGGNQVFSVTPIVSNSTGAAAMWLGNVASNTLQNSILYCNSAGAINISGPGSVTSIGNSNSGLLTLTNSTGLSLANTATVPSTPTGATNIFSTVGNGTTPAALNILDASGNTISFGTVSSYSTFPSMWLGIAPASQTISNRTMSNSGGVVQINGTVAVGTIINGTYIMYANADTIEIGNTASGANYGSTNSLIIDNGTLPTSNPSNSIILNSYPISSGNTAFCIQTQTGNNFALGGLIGGPDTSYSAFYMGVGLTPNGTNNILQTNSANTSALLNAANDYCGFGIAGTYYMRADNTGAVNQVGMPSTVNLSIGDLEGSYGATTSGVGVMFMANAGTNPVGAITGGGVLYVDSSSGNLMFIGSSGTARLVALA